MPPIPPLPLAEELVDPPVQFSLSSPPWPVGSCNPVAHPPMSEKAKNETTGTRCKCKSMTNSRRVRHEKKWALGGSVAQDKGGAQGGSERSNPCYRVVRANARSFRLFVEKFPTITRFSRRVP